ncbi:DUF4879 domain-containing protein [Bacillus sp. JK74]|uniref:DUF4879 domain-containing protein n=1 Tax=Bacillus velezensis TaxID=492670 RepID=UPI0003AA45DC|nr:DUF4879 domain-containing protein [Bacillus velezensis]AUJ61091.1 DUF4879 domain-containing protein [Bacillus velezensis]
MKKRLVLLFAAAAAALLLVSGLWAPSASAAPAPALTQIRIIGVTSDGQNYQWENIGPNQISASKPMKGTTGYLAVYFQGYPNNNSIQAFNNGTNITNLTSKALEDEYTKNGNIVTGYIKYYSVPLSYVSSGTFSFSATGLNGPYTPLSSGFFSIQVQS